MNKSIVLSLRGICSHAWNKGISDEKSCFVKTLCTIKAFLSAVFLGKYTVATSDVETLYYQDHENSIFGKEYSKVVAKENINTRSVYDVQTGDELHIKSEEEENPKLLETPKVEKVEEEVAEVAEVDAHIEPKRQIELTPEEFLALIKNVYEFQNFHYVVKGDFVYKNKSPLSLPETLTVQGRFDIKHASFKNNVFPKELIVRDDCRIIDCSEIRDLSGSKMQVGGTLTIRYCIDIEYFPAKMEADLIIIKGCTNLRYLDSEIIVKKSLEIAVSDKLERLPASLECKEVFLPHNLISLDKWPKPFKVNTLVINEELARCLPSYAVVETVEHTEQ